MCKRWCGFWGFKSYQISFWGWNYMWRISGWNIYLIHVNINKIPTSARLPAMPIATGWYLCKSSATPPRRSLYVTNVSIFFIVPSLFHAIGTCFTYDFIAFSELTYQSSVSFCLFCLCIAEKVQRCKCSENLKILPKIRKWKCSRVSLATRLDGFCWPLLDVEVFWCDLWYLTCASNLRSPRRCMD